MTITELAATSAMSVRSGERFCEQIAGREDASGSGWCRDGESARGGRRCRQQSSGGPGDGAQRPAAAVANAARSRIDSDTRSLVVDPQRASGLTGDVLVEHRIW